jgi:hypothetical protein
VLASMLNFPACTMVNQQKHTHTHTHTFSYSFFLPHSDPMPAGGYLKIAVSSSTFGKGHTDYVIAVDTNLPQFPQSNFQVKQRYSGFEKLHACLKLMEPGIPNLPLKDFFGMPSVLPSACLPCVGRPPCFSLLVRYASWQFVVFVVVVAVFFFVHACSLIVFHLPVDCTLCRSIQ